MNIHDLPPEESAADCLGLDALSLSLALSRQLLPLPLTAIFYATDQGEISFLTCTVKCTANSTPLDIYCVQERNCLLDELIRRREDYGEMSSDLQVLEAERVRLSLLQEKIKEVLAMLRTLNAMVCQKIYLMTLLPSD